MYNLKNVWGRGQFVYAVANVSEVAFLFKDNLLLRVWSLNDEEAAMLLLCLHVWLPIGGAWEREGSFEIVTNCVPSCIQACNILPRNSQVGSAQTFFMSIALVSLFV